MTPSQRILGIDPGLRFTGYGCIDVRDDPAATSPRLVEGGVIRLNPRHSLAARLAQLNDDLCELLDEHRPEVVVVEKLFSHYKQVRTAILMAHARGVIILALQQRSLRLAELAPTEVKKALTGNGHATKQQMQHAVMTQCCLNAAPNPPDVADAIALALCAARRLHSLTVAAR